MRICNWNITGFNDPCKNKEIKCLVSKHHIHILALLETRVKPHNVKKTISNMGYK